ncbi:hypothetical protein NJ7G_2222 [Natrinema sp. J7-2]|nr:hypothetical protein NJ7G_2222 [Natrinema sp. J7-2]
MNMGRSPKTDRELEPEQGHKGPGVLSAVRTRANNFISGLRK